MFLTSLHPFRRYHPRRPFKVNLAPLGPSHFTGTAGRQCDLLQGQLGGRPSARGGNGPQGPGNVSMDQRPLVCPLPPDLGKGSPDGVTGRVVVPVALRNAHFNHGAQALPHTSGAVSRFSFQMDISTAMTSAVVIRSVGLLTSCGMP